MRGTPPTENYRKKSHYETTNAWAGTLALIIFERLWVRIPAPYTRWTFFHIDFLYKLYCLFEKTKNKKKRKRGRGWAIFKNNRFQHFCVNEFQWTLINSHFKMLNLSLSLSLSLFFLIFLISFSLILTHSLDKLSVCTYLHSFAYHTHTQKERHTASLSS